MKKLWKSVLAFILLGSLMGCSSPTSVMSSFSSSSEEISSLSSSDDVQPETSLESSSEESSEEESSSEESSVYIPEDGTEIHIIYEVSDADMGSLTGILDQTIRYNETTTSEVKAKANLGYKFVGWSDGKEEDTRGEETFTMDITLTAIFDYDTLEMPIFAIDTVNAQAITSKETYVNGSLSIMNADSQYEFSSQSLGIRGRGNYSWSGTEKKSYRIKLDNKKNLMGQGKGACKSWTLLAIHCDKSMLRTDGAFYFARQLSNIPFVSSSSFVELYLNGQYDGVYELCDQIQVNEYRVDIDDTGTEDDIGCLLELDKNASEEVITINNGNTFELKSDYQTTAQKTYITNYLNSCYTAICGKNQTTVEAYLDIDSAVDCYLVEELFKNLDVGWGSFYFTKPKGGKLQFGPVWDFDLCAGNADSDDAASSFRSYKYTYVGNSAYDYSQQHDWYVKLRKCSWFNEKVASRWDEVSSYATDTVTHISDMSTTYHNSFLRNFRRWKIFSQKINREPDNILSLKSYDRQVSFLTNWLTNRITWLTNYYDGTVNDYTGN